MSKDTAPLVEALADFLYARDWPSVVRTNVQRKYEYRCLAAAIVNGEAWAIRKAWPEAAYEIETRSDWGSLLAARVGTEHARKVAAELDGADNE